jgi:hypothetical protein
MYRKILAMNSPNKTRFSDINTDLPTASDEANMAEENEPYSEADIRLFAKFIAENFELPLNQTVVLFHERVSNHLLKLEFWY